MLNVLIKCHKGHNNWWYSQKKQSNMLRLKWEKSACWISYTKCFFFSPLILSFHIMTSCRMCTFHLLSRIYNYIMVHPLLLQVHDVDQRKKWSVHGRQRQRDLPHSEPRVSFPEGSTCPLIKYPTGWGELLFFLMLVFLLDCNVLVPC